MDLLFVPHIQTKVKIELCHRNIAVLLTLKSTNTLPRNIFVLNSLGTVLKTSKQHESIKVFGSSCFCGHSYQGSFV